VRAVRGLIKSSEASLASTNTLITRFSLPDATGGGGITSIGSVGGVVSGAESIEDPHGLLGVVGAELQRPPSLDALTSARVPSTTRSPAPTGGLRCIRVKYGR